MLLIRHPNDRNHHCPIRKCSLFTVSDSPDAKRVETILGRPTTIRPYAFLHRFSVRSGRILGAAHRLGHPGRLSAARDISRSLECHGRGMVTFACRTEPVLQTTVIIGHRDPKIRDDFRTYAWSCSQPTLGCRDHSKSNC